MHDAIGCTGDRYAICSRRAPCADLSIRDHITSQEAGMPRGDELREEYRFSDRDDDEVDGTGYGGGGASYDDDEEDDGGWMTHKDESDDLWDSAEDVDDDEEESGTFEVAEEEEEADVFETPRPARAGRPAGGNRAVGGAPASTPT